MATFSSSKFSNIARPYALAAFEYARDKKQLSEWKAFLESAALIAQQSSVIKLLADPEIASAKLFEFFQSVLSSHFDESQKNFLSLVAEKKRLIILPEIAEAFNQYYSSYEKQSMVRVVTAIDMQDDFRQTITRALAKRIQRDVTLQCEIDPAILGGAIIHIGDRVIDGSVRGKLTRLLELFLR